MDEDQFNDFEEAAPVTEPEPSQNDQNQPQPPQQENVEKVQLQNMEGGELIQPSALVSNVSSSVEGQNQQSQEWRQPEVPEFVKMESDHLAQVEHMEVDFSKRKSERGINNQQNEQEKVFQEEAGNIEGKNNFSKVVEVSDRPITDSDVGGVPFVEQGSELKYSEQIQINKEGTSTAEVELFQNNQKNEQNQESLDLCKTNQNQFQEQNQEEELKVEQGLQIDQKLKTQELQPQFKQETQHFSEEVKVVQEEVKAVEDDQDEFGQFEETAPQLQEVPQDIIPSQNLEEKVESSIKVQIEPAKTPVGIDIAAKQKQLLNFVDCLPDYSFLLAESFNSL